jgi:D-3-phosphoglycerate dehydrogenase
VARLICVPQPVHEEALARLRESAEVVVGYGPEATPIEEVLTEVNAILARTEPLPAGVIERSRSLRVIARHGVGVDNIAVDAATRRGIPVLITPTANVRSVAEHVFALALAVSRRVLEADRLVRAGRFGQRDLMIGRELFGARLGVVGFGRIGREVAQIASAGFGMEVLGYDPYLPQDRIVAGGAEPAETLTDLLGASELVTIHVPLAAESRDLIGGRELAHMRPEAILIQTSRGGVVNEGALVSALREGRLAGAGIDVFDAEPPPEDHPFFYMDNIVLTPHTAAHTRQAMRRMALDAALGILAVLDGAGPGTRANGPSWQVVNPDYAAAADHEKGGK